MLSKSNARRLAGSLGEDKLANNPGHTCTVCGVVLSEGEGVDSLTLTGEPLCEAHLWDAIN